MATEGLCASCSNSIWCDVWAEWKCTVKKKRIYNHASLTECESYKKRPKDWKPIPCGCKDCQENGPQWDEEGESE